VPVKIYRHSTNIKISLLVLATGMILGLLFYTQKLVHRLREDSSNLIRFYADIYAKAAMDESIQEFNFIFESIIKEISVPMVLSQDSTTSPTAWRNLGDLDLRQDSAVFLAVEKIMREMDRENKPIPLKYGDRVLAYIHYGDTNLIKQLRFLPYVEISLVGLFILLGYISFSVIRSNEKRSIWVGMAKETAHQLGTPLTSLMGWRELLKAELGENELLDEMERDITRLEKVTKRFSQIGSTPVLAPTPLNPVISEAVNYYQRRLPQLGPSVKLEFIPGGDFWALLNPELFSWALENLIKNALDAVPSSNGKITITTQLINHEKYIAIDVSDNGKGISKKNRRNIFRPGYSTKERGWGLGLSLALRIVCEYHRGKLFVYYSKPYEKTVMRILIKQQPAVVGAV
jgi:anti-sigma regulatory factor (Ser/Thr protein kinase)